MIAASVTSRKPPSRDNTPESVAVRESERARPARLAEIGRSAEMGDRHLDGDGGPLALERTLPGHDGQPPSPPQRASEVGERGHRIVEEHRPEPADHGIEGPRLERMHLGIRLDEADAVQTGGGGTLASERERRAGDVDADRGALGRHPPRGLDRCATRSAADVEHPLTRLQIGGLEHGVAEPAARAIPAVRLADPELLGLLEVQGRALLRDGDGFVGSNGVHR